MKNICLLLFSAITFVAGAQNSASGLGAMNAARSANKETIDLFMPGKAQVYKKQITISDPSLKQTGISRSVSEKKNIPLSQVRLDKFQSIGTLTGREKTIDNKAKLIIFNNSAYNPETGVYTFNTQNPKWKGAPYVYCSNCGTIVLQLKVEKNKRYLVQVSLAAEKENTYELFTVPDLQSPEIIPFPFGAQELNFMVAPKESGYVSYYLRCVEPTSWSLSGVQVSEESAKF